MDGKIKKTSLQKVLYFFVTKIIIGIGVIVLLVAVIEWLRSSILDKTKLPDSTKALIVSVVQAFVATIGYTLLFRVYEKRTIDELNSSKFVNNATAGFLIGIALQASFILVIYLTGTFLIVNVNSISTLISPLAFALTAGFVAEIILIGIVFRLLEQQIGTISTLIVFITLFAILHINIKGATLISVGATAMQAGLLIPAAYVYGRNLWLPIFLHFGWDFAEPGIFGGINPSGSLTQGLLTSKIAGNALFTGGETGPQDSLSSLILCFVLGIIFLFLAKRKDNFINAPWKTTAVNKG